MIEAKWVVFSIIFIVGCGSRQPLETLYDSQHPIQLVACPTGDIPDPQEHAFTAIQATLANVDWVVEKRVADQFVVIGKICQLMANVPSDPLVRTDSYCVSMVFKVEGNGDVYAFRVKDKEVKRVTLRKLKDWMSRLSRHYAELRCYSEEILMESVAGKNR